MNFNYRRLAGAMALAVVLRGAGACFAASNPAEGVELFEAKIRPLLAEKCYSCHSAQSEKLKGGLRLDFRDGVLKGGETGPAIVRGDPEKSLLIKAVRYTDPDLQMPPKNKRLSQAEIADLVQWVKLGAPDPRTESAATANGTNAPYDYAALRKQWAFHRPESPSVPKIRRPSRAKSPIDHFLLAKLDAQKLPPARAADKATLIRRATFDLTGLPPTLEEIATFEKDGSANAFAKVVDRLLASPRYGECWARHWLDVVRYADSVDARQIGQPGDIDQAWRYRDWVVAAFNQDMPYNLFVENQVAGDLLPTSPPGGLNTNGIVATSMLAIGRWEQGEADKEKMVTDIIDDQIDVISRGFLGLTMACARCHDHKFDPIPTEDYYSLAGIFFSSHIMPDPGSKTGDSTRLRISLWPAELVDRRHQAERRRDAIAEELKKSAAKDSTNAPPAPDRLAALNKELDSLKAELATPMPTAHGIAEGGVPHSGYDGIADAHILKRGRYDQPDRVVPRRFPRILAGDDRRAITNGSGRLELARWLASEENPLTARVMANRVWQNHFGEGIVRTPNNFGKLGEPPTDPALLDFLADYFVRSGWSIKALHRAIMLSVAYQSSCDGPPELMKADPDNRLFGRMNRRRLDSESLRDSLLSAAGRLDGALGGPAITDLASPRRTIYMMTVRSDRSTYRMLFDAADPTAIVEKRLDSTVAPQALFLMNNAFVIDAAKTLSGRIPAGSERDRILWLYRLLYGRSPVAAELSIGENLLSERDGSGATDRAWLRYCQVLLCANEFIYID
jgi:mono/diheme cytochrome c family protein